jgi:KRAB domain-containing zinc finger protein
MKKHLRKHTGILFAFINPSTSIHPYSALFLPGERPYICNYCGIRVSQYRNLKNHMKIHTEAPKQCQYCDKTFATSLTQHLKKHEGPNVIRCSVSDDCSVPFTNPKDLKAHIKKKHSNGKPHNCTFCSKTFSRSCDLVKHRRIHSGEKLYSCTTCGKSFTHQTSLRNHKAVHSKLKPFQCSFCGQSFSFSGNLKSHIRTHTGEKPHKCKVCGKTFSRTANLNEHVKIHTGEKTHKCEVCGKAFTNSSTFSKHKKIHTGER